MVGERAGLLVTRPQMPKRERQKLGGKQSSLCATESALWHINEVHFEIETVHLLENVNMQGQVATSLFEGK